MHDEYETKSNRLKKLEHSYNPFVEYQQALIKHLVIKWNDLQYIIYIKKSIYLHVFLKFIRNTIILRVFSFHKINVNIMTDGQELRIAKIKNY